MYLCRSSVYLSKLPKVTKNFTYAVSGEGKNEAKFQNVPKMQGFIS